MDRSTLEPVLLLDIPLRVGAHGGMWICFTCAGPAVIGGLEEGVRQSVQQAKQLILKFSEFTVYNV